MSSPPLPRWALPLAALTLPLACQSSLRSPQVGPPSEASAQPSSASAPGSAPEVASAPVPSASGALAASAAGSGAPAPSDPPVRDAKVKWVLNPVDHTRSFRLTTTEDGGVVVMGQSDAFLGARDDMFVTRLNAEGETGWQRLGVGRFVQATRATPEFLYILTEFSGRVRFGGLKLDGSDHASEMMVARMSMKGEAHWASLFSSPDYDRAVDLAPLPDGGVVAVHGAFAAPRQGPVTFRVAGGQDTLLSRWGTDGSLTWVKSLEWPGYDEPAGVVASGGALHAAGSRWKSASTSMGDLDSGACQGWVGRFKPDGEVEWLKALGEPDKHTRISALAEGPGGVVLAGTLRGKTTLGEVVVDGGKGSGFVAQLDATGAVKWAHAIPAPTCLALSPSGQVYVTTGRDVLRVSAAGEQSRIFHAEPKDVAALNHCAMHGADRLFVSGVAPVDASVGGVKIGKPRTVRSPAWMSTYEVAFVARLDL